MTLRLVVAATLASLLSACHTAPPRSRASAGKSAALALERGLALQAPTGDRTVDKLLAQMQERVGRDPDKLDAWIRLAHLWIRKARETADPGYYQNAEACAAIALQLSPDSALALDVRGLVLLNDHRFAEARDLAQQILAKRPDDVTALGTLSDALLELGRYDEAAQATQKMVSLKPNLPSYSRSSYLLWLRGDVTGAELVARHAIDSAGDAETRAWVLVQAATYFWHEGDADGAEAGYDAALAAFPGFPPALVGKGRVALGHDRAAVAASLFERAYQQSPLVETAWLLGDARARAGDTSGAQAAYELVMKTGSADPRTLAFFLASKDRDHARAAQLAADERAVRDDLYTEDVYAWALYRAGRLDEAGAAIARALAFGTRDARLLYHAGAIELSLGRDAEGATHLRAALALNPRFDAAGAADAKRLLGQLREQATAQVPVAAPLALLQAPRHSKSDAQLAPAAAGVMHLP